MEARIYFNISYLSKTLSDNPDCNKLYDLCSHKPISYYKNIVGPLLGHVCGQIHVA